MSTEFSDKYGAKMRSVVLEWGQIQNPFIAAQGLYDNKMIPRYIMNPIPTNLIEERFLGFQSILMNYVEYFDIMILKKYFEEGENFQNCKMFCHPIWLLCSALSLIIIQ